MKINQIVSVSSDKAPRIIALCEDGRLYVAWLNDDQTIDKWHPLATICGRTIEKETMGQVLPNFEELPHM